MNFLKATALLLITVFILFSLIEFFIPLQYSEAHIISSGRYKKAFVGNLDWISHEFRPIGYSDNSYIKQLYPCSSDQKRVLVVGDSFVYGKGAVINTTWDAQLASLVAFSGEAVCLIAIGKNGWNTKDELNFLQEHWSKLNPDFVFLGYVSNDADFHDKNKQYWFKFGPKSCSRIYPVRLLNWISSRICHILEVNHPTIGYAQWEHRLHEEDNLEKYRTVIKSFRDFMNEKDIPLHVLLTEESWEYGGQMFNKKIARLLKEENVAFSDPLPMVTQYFSAFPQIIRWANPGDGHPSALVNAIYSWYAYDILCKVQIISNKCEEFRIKVLGKFAKQIQVNL